MYFRIHPFLAGLLVLLIGATSRAHTSAEVNLHLSRHFDTIAEEAHRERMTRGWVYLGLGAAGTTGFFLARGSSDPDIRGPAATSLLVAGGIFLIGGGLSLAFPTEFERVPKEYQSIPHSAADALAMKVDTGRDMLKQLSRRARRERLIGAGTLATLGVAQLVWYAADSRGAFPLYSGLTALGLSALSFFLPTSPEDEADAFERWDSQKTGLLTPEADAGVYRLSMRWRF